MKTPAKEVAFLVLVAFLSGVAFSRAIIHFERGNLWAAGSMALCFLLLVVIGYPSMDGGRS